MGTGARHIYGHEIDLIANGRGDGPVQNTQDLRKAFLLSGQQPARLALFSSLAGAHPPYGDRALE